MASSSSNSFNSSTAFEIRREMTPEFDSGAAHEACAPLHRDLQFLLDEELEDEDDDDDESWDGYDSSSGEEEDDEPTEEDPTAGSFLRVRSSNEDDDRDNDGDSDGGANSDDGTSSDNGVGDDSSDGGSGDGDVGVSPPIKCRRSLGTYWW
jgi:hypothetical protein